MDSPVPTRSVDLVPDRKVPACSVAAGRTLRILERCQPRDATVSVASDIHDLVVTALQPVRLDVLDESSKHNVPVGAESHFKLTIVAASFAGESMVVRHRRVNRVLDAQLAGPVHALGLHTYTPEEWSARGESVPASPPCRGGSAAATQ